MSHSYVKIAAALFFVSSILGYTYFQTRNIITGPTISITLPANGTTLSESLITIEGEAHNITHISINDRQIFVDEEGNFQEQLLLPYGYTIITIEARDKFGRYERKTLELVYK